MSCPVKKIGLMGGTFDPVHTVHLIAADQARTSLGLDEVWFIPAHIPPHKREKRITDDSHRIAMLKLAIDNHPAFCLSTVEIDTAEMGKPSFTYDTMLYLNNRYPDTAFYFIIGGDMVEYLHHWNRIDELVQMVRFVALARPGYLMKHPFGDRITEVEMPQLDVSSTMIRNFVSQRRSIRYLVPEAVRLYIEENGLYGS
ncbi:nicotinate-nucleotide adenylyltransferase [Aneurinibacillus sp. Ricciae_BoGa-3]|uniref:nicotinate-nucleotide adenylyltransferase n=1 Tax=Aneurinibacillus sp. Ricciae_BoGa-3 TaxID=3022697 RepID=UPI002340845F|nr:nicotinate-nucleotide adenylyltransferase [Aneurinibacillus sp. Ricciae_BoGa-3]WCK53519.1 nicotinate-nucleotide adenylyltransferase [Aneurinibacillus sp. Ricciae_BoGa-3]